MFYLLPVFYGVTNYRPLLKYSSLADSSVVKKNESFSKNVFLYAASQGRSRFQKHGLFFFFKLFTLESAVITDFSLSRPTVTEKGYESESYSETEDDLQATKQAVKDPAPVKPATSNKQEEKKGHKKNSASTNKGAKQASIMGFFQKKWSL